MYYIQLQEQTLSLRALDSWSEFYEIEMTVRFL
jgi:hypothetical protein